ncbi:hypothetical protein [Kosakonia cowanii]
MNDNSFGAWSEDDLKITLQREIESGRPLVDDNYGGDWEKFKITTIHELRKRFSTTMVTNDSSCIFILQNSNMDIPQENPFKLIRTFFISSGKISYEHKIFITTAQVQRGLYFCNDFSDMDNLAEIIENLDLLNNPCIFFNNHNGDKIVELYPNGFVNDYEDKINISASHITEETIFNVFEKAYQSSLKTPTALNNAGCDIWEDPAKYIPSDQVEKKIQRTLYTALSTNFNCHLMPLCEVSIEDGRLDFLIISKELKGRLNSHAVVELKALRSLTQSGKEYTENVKKEWITKGMNQVISFSNKFIPQHSILSCYDMSKDTYTDDYWFSDTKDLADKNKVKQWRWRIFNSAEASRR